MLHMDIQICIMSAMSPQQTKDYFKHYGVECEAVDGRIQRVRWVPPRRSAITVSLWITTCHPLIYALGESFLPYMDATMCLWHDHDALSCIKIPEAVPQVEAYTQSIWLASTTYPPKLRNTGRAVRKFYDMHGFERPLYHQSTLVDMIERITKHHISMVKHLK